ncbi:hypothetical protein [Lichenifustis flavocetrariae]|uniref:Uncharacterized protein n=1 Tax=Lichenifustis flavocetrariae TaxID=2949735 RepID=A0AA42CH02_9HYPH|nr:hypothetical protein [Lichenifustis flavocetrariae]MCW6507083.1 hypothetical protein [Lichenifustis flavocetrariae]
MADVDTIMARLAQGRPSTVHVVDPVSRGVREVSVDQAFAACVTGDTVFVPMRDSLSERLQHALRLTDEAKAIIEEVLTGMIADCAVTTVGDDVLRQALGHLVERGFDVVPEAKR